ncbi:MAG: hypothetical protein H6732_18555 [Alphaproteobacteria bacterium]|nr:hypothetical protein [Alphaproteobacteria bacterium]
MTLAWPVFLDRCVGGRLMRARLAESGWDVLSHDEVFVHTAADPDWIATVAAAGRVIVTRDKNIRRKPENLRAFLRAGARVVFVVFQGPRRAYEDALLKGARALQVLLDTREPPLAVALHRSGRLELLVLPDAAAEA